MKTVNNIERKRAARVGLGSELGFDIFFYLPDGAGAPS